MGGPVNPGTLIIGLTSGDPAGIGPEIALKAWAERARHKLPPFVMYAEPEMLSARARMLGLCVPVEICQSPDQALSIYPRALPVIASALSVPANPGKPDSANAAGIINAINSAVDDCAHRRTSAVVTNPIAKSVLYKAGFNHPGHTEYLAELSAKHWPGQAHTAVMMLASDMLRIVPLTIHVPLKDVPPLITKRLISETAHIVSAALQRDFGISNPRISVAGLNPHAGEGGALGVEDRDIIEPAIKELQREGLAITGPHSADTMFHAAARLRYDAAIAMYHDQALIPVKTLAFDKGVNVTLGLPFVRTSPDHGTAFDIATQGQASPGSLVAALKLAGIMAGRRAKLRV